MSKCISGTQRVASTLRRWSTRCIVVGLRTQLHFPFQPNFVGETGIHVERIETGRQYWQHQYHHTDDGCQPKIDALHRPRQSANIRSAQEIIVHVIGRKVEDHTAPDGDVIDDGPIGCVESNLAKCAKCSVDD